MRRASAYICYLTNPERHTNAAFSGPGIGATPEEARAAATYWENQLPYVRTVPRSRAPRWAVEAAEESGFVAVNLEPGIYRLASDVANPFADRRYRDERAGWTRAPWKTGMVFYVTTNPWDGKLELHSGTEYDRGVVPNWDTAPLELLAALERVPVDTVSRLLEHADHVRMAPGGAYLEDAVQVLVDQGLVTLEQLTMALGTAFERASAQAFARAAAGDDAEVEP